MTGVCLETEVPAPVDGVAQAGLGAPAGWPVAVAAGPCPCASLTPSTTETQATTAKRATAEIQGYDDRTERAWLSPFPASATES